MNTIELFKNDLWNGIWAHAKKLFKFSVLPGLVAFILMGVVAYFMGKHFMNSGIFPEGIFEGGTGFEEIMERNDRIKTIILDNLTALIAPLLLAGLGFLLIVTWVLNVLLRLSKGLVEENSANLGEAISGSFNKNWLNLILYSLIVFIANNILTAIIDMVPLPMVLNVLISVVLTILFLRFFAGRASIVIGDLNVVDSIRFSWGNITFARASKLLLVIVVASIVFGLGVVLSTALFSFLGGIGGFLVMLSFIFYTILLASLATAGLSASFYRYAEVEYETPEDQHLIDDIV